MSTTQATSVGIKRERESEDEKDQEESKEGGNKRAKR